jgi:hypothetical protein
VSAQDRIAARRFVAAEMVDTTRWGAVDRAKADPHFTH